MCKTCIHRSEKGRKEVYLKETSIR